MSKKHIIIYVPGLGDQLLWNHNVSKVIPLVWRLHGWESTIFKPLWNTNESFQNKLKRLTKTIDELSKKTYTVSLVGQSAGGSLVLNAFCARKDMVHKVVNVTGRLRRGKNVRPSLKWAARASKSFYESVVTFEDKNEPKLTAADRKRVMCIRPHFDFIVPKSTQPLIGATNRTAFFDHSIGGVLICTLLAPKLFEFIEKNH